MNLRPFTQGHPDTVNSCVTTPDHADLLTHSGRFAHIGIAQKLDTASEETVVAFILTFDTHRLRFVSTGSQQHGIMLLFQLHQADVNTDLGVIDNIDTHGTDNIDITLKDMTRHPVGRNTDSNHTTAKTFRQGFVDGAGITFESQIVGSRKTSRAGSDNGDILVFFGFGCIGGW